MAQKPAWIVARILWMTVEVRHFIHSEHPPPCCNNVILEQILFHTTTRGHSWGKHSFWANVCGSSGEDSLEMNQLTMRLKYWLSALRVFDGVPIQIGGNSTELVALLFRTLQQDNDSKCTDKERSTGDQTNEFKSHSDVPFSCGSVSVLGKMLHLLRSLLIEPETAMYLMCNVPSQEKKYHWLAREEKCGKRTRTNVIVIVWHCSDEGEQGELSRKSALPSVCLPHLSEVCVYVCVCGWRCVCVC